jgi:hypothetical protein
MRLIKFVKLHIDYYFLLYREDILLTTSLISSSIHPRYNSGKKIREKWKRKAGRRNIL